MNSKDLLRLGVGANFKERRAHEVMEADWSVSPIAAQNKVIW